MAKVEIDEEEVRRMTALQGTVQTLWANPEARKLIQRAQKLVDPKAKTPDLDQEAAVLEPVNKLAEEFKNFVAETKAEKAEREKNEKLESLRRVRDDGFRRLREQKYTDAGITAIEKLMDEKGILDPLDAAAIFDKANPPQTPVTPGGSGSWNFTELPQEGADQLKKLIDTKGQNDLVSEKMAWDAINDLRGASRR